MITPHHTKDACTQDRPITLLRLVGSWVLLVWVIGWVPEPAAAGNTPPLFIAEYKLYRKGIAVAAMQLSHKTHQDGYLLRQETRTSGLLAVFHKVHVLEQSHWIMQEQKLRPLRYSYERTGGKRERHVKIHFDWVQGLIVNTINNDSWRMPAEQEIMDKLLYNLAVMHQMNSGRPLRPYTIADGGKSKIYYFKRLGEEVIDTTSGQYQTVKIQRIKTGDIRKTLLWCAPELHHIPVQIHHTEKDGVTIQARLRSIRFLDIEEA